MSRRYKDFVMLYLLSIVIGRFENDELPLTAHELAVRDHLPIRLVNQLLGRMVDTRILREVYADDEEERTYQPALDTHKITVGMVIERIEAQGTEMFIQKPSEEMQAFWESYMHVMEQKNKSINELLISEIQ
jgi:membrane protein